MRVVHDDASLQRAFSAAVAGDVIQLKSGDYRGGVHVTLNGEKDRPILIESADNKSPATIRGGGSGLQLSSSNYVTIRHLRFVGATGNGLNIDDGGQLDQPSVGIVIDSVDVSDVGPKGNCDGIKLSGLKNFVVRNCTVEGWGGNAIDLVGCHEGVIEQCTVRGKQGFTPSTGPQLKGGTSNVAIRECLFDRSAQRAINAGGSTGIPFFRPKDAPYEAKDLTIEHNVFIGSDTPVAFVGVDGAQFRNNTIIAPERWVMRILQESRDARFVKCRNVTFERNLIVHDRQRVRTHANIGPDTEPVSFVFKENWWYCQDRPNDRPDLPSREIDAVHGKDPRIDRNSDWPMPANPEAKSYGAKARTATSANQ